MLALIKQQEKKPTNPLTLPDRPTDAKIMETLDKFIDPTIRSSAAARPRPHYSLPNRMRSAEPYGLVHLDIKHFDVPSYYGDRYALVIVDDFSRVKTTFALQKKSDLLPKLYRFITMVLRPQGYNLRVIRLDNAGEAKGTRADDFFSKMCIHPQYTEPYESEQNGIGERGIFFFFPTVVSYLQIIYKPSMITHPNISNINFI
jgi:hypothetical protein